MGTDITRREDDSAEAATTTTKRAKAEALGDRIASIAASIDAATQQQLTAIRHFDEIGGWAMQGAKTCAHWLSWRIGLGIVTAREKVRVAKALGKLPQIDATFATGAISYTKVRAMVRVATPENESLLLEQARTASGATLEAICSRYRALQRGALLDPDRRFVRQRNMPDGTVQLTIRLMPDEAETVMAALHQIRRELDSAETDSADETDSAESDSAESESPRAESSESESSESESPTLVDAAVTLALDALHGRPRNTPAGQRHLLFVHLRQDDAAAPWTTELHDGTPLCSDSLRRLACDASLVTALTDENNQPLALGRRRRTVSAPLLRALELRDRHCRFPGCTSRAYLDAHHIQHWLHGGNTDADNLLLVCRHHHTQLHEGGCTVAMEEGRPAFRDPRGAIIPASPSRPSPTTLPAQPPTTNLITWDGSPRDLAGAVDALSRRDHDPANR